MSLFHQLLPRLQIVRILYNCAIAAILISLDLDTVQSIHNHCSSCFLQLLKSVCGCTSDTLHSSSNSSHHARRCVFKNQAIFGVFAQNSGCLQIAFRMRFALRELLMLVSFDISLLHLGPSLPCLQSSFAWVLGCQTVSTVK